jgi:cytochrome c oxidase subunit 2
MKWRRSPIAGALPFLLGACTYQRYQSDFGNAGIEDSQFLTLFTIFLVVCGVIYLLVIAFLSAGIMRSRRASDANVVETGRHHVSDPLMRRTLIGWAVLIGVGLAALAVASFLTDRSMARAAANEKLSIKLTANQWWWDAQYNSSDPSKIIRTANELHVPVGVPVRITLASNDVIHSFWVPSLSGKQDLIPGRETDITIVPRKTGIFRGQCAEFCGTQHAHMSLIVDVDSYPEFIKWWNHQLQPAPAPRTPLALAGYKYVTTGPCSACHNIAGTSASGRIAPDLTHLASRRSIAAGTLPMSTGNLYGWIEDPQSLKPGNRMPTIGLEPDQLHAVVAYLETLK